MAAALDAAALGEAARAAFPAHLEVQRLGSRLLQRLASRAAEPEPEVRACACVRVRVCVCVCMCVTVPFASRFLIQPDTPSCRTAGAGCRRWRRQQHPNSPARRVACQFFYGRGAGAGVHRLDPRPGACVRICVRVCVCVCVCVSPVSHSFPHTKLIRPRGAGISSNGGRGRALARGAAQVRAWEIDLPQSRDCVCGRVRARARGAELVAPRMSRLCSSAAVCTCCLDPVGPVFFVCVRLTHVWVADTRRFDCAAHPPHTLPQCRTKSRHRRSRQRRATSQ